MILMPIIMVMPILGLLLFSYFSLAVALPLYVVILIVSLFYNAIMIWSMMAKAKNGIKAMVGKTALVTKDIDPEGKVEIWGEIWAATGRKKRIFAGNEVKILAAEGLSLIVAPVNEDEQ